MRLITLVLLFNLVGLSGPAMAQPVEVHIQSAAAEQAEGRGKSDTAPPDSPPGRDDRQEPTAGHTHGHTRQLPPETVAPSPSPTTDLSTVSGIEVFRQREARAFTPFELAQAREQGFILRVIEVTPTWLVALLALMVLMSLSMLLYAQIEYERFRRLSRSILFPFMSLEKKYRRELEDRDINDNGST